MTEQWIDRLECRRLLSGVYASDLAFVSSTNGWGPVKRDVDIADNPIVIGGAFQPKGLGVHAPSEVVFDLNGNYDWFLSQVGVSDTYGDKGSVVFQVFADGAKIYDSGLTTGADTARAVDVPIGGVEDLRLVVTQGPDGFAYDVAAWGDAQFVSAPPEPGSPQAPANLAAVAAVAGSSSFVKLTWGDRSNAETGFRIERSTNGAAFVPIATVNGANMRSYDDTTVAPSASYAYRVVAFNAHGDSAPSAAASVATPSPGNFISDLTFVSSTNGWGPVKRDVDTVNNPLVVNGASYARGLGVLAQSEVVLDLGGDYVGFQAQVGVPDSYGSSGSVVFQVFADGVKAYDSGLMTGADAARAVDVAVGGVEQLRLVVTDGGDGPGYDLAVWGNARIVTAPPQPGPPLAPSNVVVTESSASLVGIAWDPLLNETGFRIERSTNGSAFTTVATLGINARAFNDAAVAPLTTYVYRVVAVNADGEAAATRSVTTPPPTDFLSDLPFASSTNGWGPVERDKDNGPNGANDGSPIVIGGTYYPKGIGVHAPSEVVFNVNAGYTLFRADLGISDTQGNNGSVVFQVFADGIKIYESPVLTGASGPLPVSLDVEGADQLKLVVTPGTDGNPYDHAVWANARVQRAAPPQPAAPHVPGSLTGFATVAELGTSEGKVHLAWRDRSNNETSFTIERSTDGITFAEIATVPANQRAYIDTGRDPLTTYIYRVRASNPYGSSAYSDAAAVATLPLSDFISDLAFVSSTNAWGPVKRDADTINNPLVVNGATYAKGLGVLAPSEVVFDLGGDYARFQAQVGISDSYGNAGSVVFQVFADGLKIYDSGVMFGADPARAVDVAVGGVGQLRLVVTNAGDGNAFDVAVWGDARLILAPELTAPGAPTHVVATPLSPSDVTVTWHDHSGIETGFAVERSVDGGAFTQIAEVGRNVRSYHDTTAAPLRTYTYRVRAFTANHHSQCAQATSVTTPPNALDVDYLGDLPFASAVNGLGPVERNTNNGGAAAGDGTAISLNGVTYAKGLGVSGHSEVTFDLGGAYARFLSDVGVDDVIAGLNKSMLIFRVYADGVKIYDSGTVTSDSQTKAVDVSVAGIQVLKLEVVDGGDGMPDDLADWANARLVLASTGVPLYPAAPLSALATASGNIRLDWSDTAENEEGFRVLRSTNGVDFEEIGTAPADATSYVDTSAAPRVKYTYRVAAFNADGPSAPSGGAVAVSGVTYLSDLPFAFERNGYGPVERDMDTGELHAHDGTTITVEGVTYSKGIALHPMKWWWEAPAEVVFDLGGQYTRFQSDIGIDDRYGIHGTVAFRVYADDVLVFESSTMTGQDAARSVDLDMTGVHVLTLMVLDGGDGYLDDHSVWAGARLV